jgi:hypothetical protein
VSRVNARKHPAKMVQRGLWRDRAHDKPHCSCFVLRIPDL